MKVGELEQKVETFGGSVDLNEVADSLGVSREVGHSVARYLHDIGWAKVSFREDSPSLILTPLGYAEIDKLKYPEWRKFLDRNPKVLALCWAVVGSLVTILTALAIESAKRNLWP